MLLVVGVAVGGGGVVGVNLLGRLWARVVGVLVGASPPPLSSWTIAKDEDPGGGTYGSRQGGWQSSCC